MEHELLEVEIGLGNDGLASGDREALGELIGMFWQGRHVCILSFEQLEKLTLLQENIPSLTIKVHGATQPIVSVYPQEH